MPSAYTSLGFNKQAEGENENAWGDVLNDEMITPADHAIRGRTAFALSGSKTLTSANGIADEAQAAILHITSGTGGTVTIPSYSKLYVVINDSAGDVIISAGGATTATVAAGEVAHVVADGQTKVKKVRYTDFGGSRLTSVGNPSGDQDAATKAYVDATAFDTALPGGAATGEVVRWNGSAAAWDTLAVGDITGAAPTAAPSFTGGATIAGGATVTGGATISGAVDLTGVVTQTGGSVGNVTALGALQIDFSSSDAHTKSISSNSTFTFTGFVAGKLQTALLVLTITSGAVPSWPASVKHPGGNNPSSTLGNGAHYLGLITADGGTNVLLVVLGRAAA